MFVNISQSSEKPFMVNARDITYARKYPDSGEFSLYNREGRLIYGKLESWNIDFDTMIARLIDAGADLAPAHQNHTPGNGSERVYPTYFSPSAVQYLTVSNVHAVSGRAGIVMGVIGYGRHETTTAHPQEAQAVIDAISKAKPLLHFTPDEAHSRFYEPRCLYLDPACIKALREDPIQVNVWFKNNDRLDVETPKVDFQDIFRTLIMPIKNPTSEQLETLIRQAQTETDDLAHKRRTDVADRIAGEVKNLLKIPDAQYTTYVTPSAIATITTWEEKNTSRDSKYSYGLSLGEQETAHTKYPESISVYFNSESARKKAIVALGADTYRPHVNTVKRITTGSRLKKQPK